MSRDDATLLDMLKAARLVVAFKGKLAPKMLFSVMSKLSLLFCINCS